MDGAMGLADKLLYSLTVSSLTLYFRLWTCWMFLWQPTTSQPLCACTHLTEEKNQSNIVGTLSARQYVSFYVSPKRH